MGLIVHVGELRTMFALEEEQTTYLDKFFAENASHPAAIWIHDLGKHQYADASQTLLEQSRQSNLLASKHVRISVPLDMQSTADNDATADA